jgi:predicted DNA-binding protein YlxM (UPF0122 family)
MIGKVMLMEKFVEQSLLYDFYGELLTERQKRVFEDVVLNDYSLSEVAADLEISRQGVHDMIKRCNLILDGYESKLHLVEKFLHIKESASEINRYAEEILSHNDDTELVRDRLLRIRTLSDQIVEEL